MVIRFVQDSAGDIFRVLREDELGAWLISCESPAMPFYVDQTHLSALTRTTAPKSFCYDASPGSKAALFRLSLIQPLLEGEDCISDKSCRLKLTGDIAKDNGVSRRRVLNIYYRYLATGCTMRPRPRKSPRKRDDFDSAIRKYYYSAKRFSLRSAYEMLILDSYTGQSGKIAPDAPSFGTFHHYFYERGYHKDPQKIIAREGLQHHRCA